MQGEEVWAGWGVVEAARLRKVCRLVVLQIISVLPLQVSALAMMVWVLLLVALGFPPRSLVLQRTIWGVLLRMWVCTSASRGAGIKNSSAMIV